MTDVEKAISMQSSSRLLSEIIVKQLAILKI